MKTIVHRSLVNIKTTSKFIQSLLRFKSIALSVLILLVFFGANEGKAQTVVQSGFTGVLVPQYMGSGNSTRLPIMFRATLSGLTANTSYRYYCQASLVNGVGGTSSGAGNPLLISSTGTTYSYTSSPGFTTAGTYETLTTDSCGSFTGWFGFVYTGNAAFTAGNVIYPIITLNAGGTATAVATRKMLDQGITVLAFATCSIVRKRTPSAPPSA